MTRRVIDLSTLHWQMGRVPRAPFGPHPPDDCALVAEWLPASIPGDVRADLIAAGRIPPVDSPDGIAAGDWVDHFDWWYRTSLPGLPADVDLAVLEADGIDYYSALWLDGRLLATHAGMFSRQTIDLSPYLTGPGDHRLAIRIWGGGAALGWPRSLWQRLLRRVLNIVEPSMDHLSERMALPKAQFSFGWDFAPRLLSAGIWDDMRLVLAHGAYLADLWAYGEPLVEGADPGPVLWHVRLRAECRISQPIAAEVTIAPERTASPDAGPGDGVQSRTFELCPAGASPSVFEGELLLEMPAARLWWPWDQGEPCLYRVTVRLRSGPDVLDVETRLAGARSVRRDPLPGGQPWRFVVNGRPLFLRGANWAPADVLPGRVRPPDYARLAGQARAAGFNFLRVWAGGVREKRAFWDECDRLGLLAWQEFPLACDFFDSYPRDRGYLDALAQEAAATVVALRGHPSLIAWCGGNEIDTRREAEPLRVIAAQVARYDGTRPWIPASPSDGDVHQWDVWHARAPWAGLADVDLPLMSEFGLQALPDPATLAEMFPHGVPRSWRDAAWPRRFAQVAKLRHYAGLTAGDLSPAEAVCVTQRVQATALQVGVEACRLRRDTCGGVAIWQLDEPWPAVSWAIIDHAGRPKAAYGRLAACCQPLLIAARFPWQVYAAGDVVRAELWVANDSPTSWSNCRAEVTFDGNVAWSRDGIDVGPLRAGRIGDLSCTLDRAPQVLALRLLGAGPDGRPAVLASNEYDLSVAFPGEQPAGDRLYHWLAKLIT